jgi:hypothetical protein
MGTDCPLVRGTEVVLDPRRFARIPAFSETQSAGMFQEMVDFELVDPDGVRLADTDDIEEVADWYISHSQGPSPTLGAEEIRVVWSTHRASSQHVYEEAVWLSDHL